MLDKCWFWIYCIVGAVASIFNGVYANTIWFRPPDFGKPAEKVDWKAWSAPWNDLRCHPDFVHGAWVNFLGAAAGWASGGYLWWRVANCPSRFSWVEAGLSLTAGLGMCGFLPNVLSLTVAAIREVAKSLLGLLLRLARPS